MAGNSRGRPPERWKARVKEYMCERGAVRRGELDQARRESLDRENWSFFFAVATALGTFRERGIRTVDRHHLAHQ